MASQSWWQDIVPGIYTPGTLYNTYTTAKSLLGSATSTDASNGVGGLAPNFFNLGSMIQIEAVVAISNIVTTPGTMNFQVRIGGVAAFDTGAVVITTTAHTTIPLYIKILMTCRSVGNGTRTTFVGQAQLSGRMIQIAASTAGADSTTFGSCCNYPDTAPAVGTGLDNTIPNTFDFFGGFSISNAGNGMQIHQYSATSRNCNSP